MLQRIPSVLGVGEEGLRFSAKRENFKVIHIQGTHHFAGHKESLADTKNVKRKITAIVEVGGLLGALLTASPVLCIGQCCFNDSFSSLKW